jgi:hypothetical protein
MRGWGNCYIETRDAWQKYLFSHDGLGMPRRIQRDARPFAEGTYFPQPWQTSRQRLIADTGTNVTYDWIGSPNHPLPFCILLDFVAFECRDQGGGLQNDANLTRP